MPEESDTTLSAHDQKLIEEGQQLVQRMDTAQLKVGRLALEFAPMGERGYRTGAGERAEIYADRVGLLASTLKVYRATAHAWGVTDVKDDEFSFSVLQTLAAVGRKEELLAKLRETTPPEGKNRWVAKDALVFARAQGFFGPPKSPKISSEDRRAIAAGEIEPPVVTARYRQVAAGDSRNTHNGPDDTPRSINLGFLGETLRKMSFASIEPGEREELDPLLAKIEAEVKRLRTELNHLTPKARPERVAVKQRAAR